MINLKQWMEICNYKVTEGGEYSPGTARIYSLDSWSGTQDGYSLFIGFDTNTQEVYTVEVHDYKNERSYRLINPDFAEHFKDTEAYDGIEFTDLEVDEDFIEKATAIINGEEYNTGILVQLDLPDSMMLELFKLAHEANMTFNEYVNMILRNMVDTLNKENE